MNLGVGDTIHSVKEEMEANVPEKEGENSTVRTQSSLS
jgi:hypothetical protein